MKEVKKIRIKILTRLKKAMKEVMKIRIKENQYNCHIIYKLKVLIFSLIYYRIILNVGFYQA